jgi:hypothetical protein
MLPATGHAVSAHTEADCRQGQNHDANDCGSKTVSRIQQRGNAEYRAEQTENQIDPEENGFHDIPLLFMVSNNASLEATVLP